MGLAARYTSDKSAVCDFCSRTVSTRSAVVWQGRTEITCCRQCVEEALPMLIADSLVLKEGISPFHAAEKEWNGRFFVRFLRALMSRCAARKED
jgi:hypothetical protein